MTKKEYDKAASFWEAKESSAKKMPEAMLKEKVAKFLEQHNTCALATGGGKTIRCTPLEYTYFNKCIYILSEGGLKFRGLKESDAVCVAVYETYSGGFGKLNGMQISGKAVIVEGGSDEYSSLLNFKKIPLAAIQQLTHPMYCIKIIPSRIDYLCTAFKEDGFDARQTLCL